MKSRNQLFLPAYCFVLYLKDFYSNIFTQKWLFSYNVSYLCQRIISKYISLCKILNYDLIFHTYQSIFFFFFIFYANFFFFFKKILFYFFIFLF